MPQQGKRQTYSLATGESLLTTEVRTRQKQQSEMYAKPASGMQFLAEIVGQKLCGIRRWVFSLGRANDELGDGITELAFEQTILVFRVGQNEDYFMVERGAVAPGSLDANFWSEVRPEVLPAMPLNCRVSAIDVYSDGVEDVAVLFRFENGETIVIALVDTDLVLARSLDIFDKSHEPIMPKLRLSLDLPVKTN